MTAVLDIAYVVVFSAALSALAVCDGIRNRQARRLKP